MKWRIAVALVALVPVAVVALRDGKLTPDELEELGARLDQLLVGLLLKQ